MSATPPRTPPAPTPGTPPEARAAPGAEAPGRHARGFHHAGRIVAPKLAAAAKRLGFTEARLLTDWAEIAGPEIAAATRPVRMTRARGAGAAPSGTLTIEADGARAPEVQMMLPTLKARVNAALGWPAVARIRVTQTRSGFAEAPRPFRPAPAPPPDPARLQPLLADLSSIGDGGLRGALETLARNVLSRRAFRSRPGTR